MTTKQEKLKLLVESALADFNAHEDYLLSQDLSERCICSKFAMYLERAILQSEFSDYKVDVEYNRGAKGNEFSKKVIRDKQRIFADLIVHKRGYDDQFGFDNLICIEMKKSNDKRSLSDDQERLRIMTDNFYGFGYRMGFLIIADIKKYELQIREEYCNSCNY